MSPRLVRLVAAAALGAAATLVGPFTAPAQAAGCSGATGVTVVVDFHQLGGGVQQACDADGGGKAASVVFPDSGFPLTYVQRQPGFVCRVSGTPASDPCVNTPPASAYWSLWWSDGKSGTWTYSTVGVGSLKVPSGGYVAFSWQGQEGKAAPGVTPAPRTSKAPSSPAPSGGGGGGSTGGGTRPPATSPSPAATPSPGTSTSPSEKAAGEKREKRAKDEKRKKKGKAEASESPSASESPELSADSAPSGGEPAVGEEAEQQQDGGRLPAWASFALVGVVLTGAAAVAAVRARRAAA